MFLYFGTVYLCWGSDHTQPDFMMLKNSFVFMCIIGTYLFYIILFWGVDSFEVFHLVWVQVHFPLWEDKCDRL